MAKDYDFSGWATRNNIQCADGRVIKKDAFIDNDGKAVPLVWNHNHQDQKSVLGHALLENRNDGVYAYCKFNDSEEGKRAKLLVKNHDITALSIYANKLRQEGENVIHGAIREVSLVLAGANPGAYIDNVLCHGESSQEEAIIYNACEDEIIYHSDCDNEENKDDSKNIVEDNKKVENDNKDKVTEDSTETVQDVFDTLTEKQKKVVYALIGQALEEKDSQKGDNTVKHNAFENEDYNENEDGSNDANVLTHDAFNGIVKEARSKGSLKETFLEHSIDHIDYLFPEAQAVNKTPELISRDMGWVNKVMKSVHHTPFSRVKSMAANITADEARAKGYVKGKKKVDEVITALKRVTGPQTVYKTQHMDRDDVIDITGFDVIAWIKSEMRVMLEEELARAILFGDGRSASSDDKINPQMIRPIYGDDSVYCTNKVIVKGASDTEDVFVDNAIKGIVKSKKDYKGSGVPTLFTTEDFLTSCLLLQDKEGRDLYDSIEKLARKLRVKEIVTVEPLESVAPRINDTKNKQNTLFAIMVDLEDYNIGADKGGAVNMFDDFDINYNKLEYLIETRCSGALVKPYSAVTFEKEEAYTEPQG